jgi:hypothetical protein
MARYNSVITSTSVSAGTTFITPGQGSFTEITASGVTLQLANPALYSGSSQTFYNASGGAGTLSTTTNGGNISLPSGTTTSLTISALAATTLVSDGTNWIATASLGGPVFASILSATSIVTLSPAALVTISPTGGLTIAPATVAGTIDNVAIGGNTRAAGAFTTLSANSTITLSPAAAVAISPTGGLTISPTSVAGTIDNVAIGNTTKAAGGFTSLSSNAATTFTRNGQGTTATDAAHSVVITGGLGVSGTIYSVGLIETSSIAFKENINPITGALDAILKLTGVTYDRKDNKSHEAGLIAEHVYKHAPDLVALDENGKPYGIHYTKISAYLIECIKSLQVEIDELKNTKNKKMLKGTE